jgi:uncharacterized protein YjdB
MITMTLNSHAQSRLIHYWNFNSFINNDTIAATSGPGTIFVLNNRIRPIPVDYTNITSPAASWVYREQPGVSSFYPSIAGTTVSFTYEDFVAGGTVNARLGAVAGNGTRPRNPSDSMEVRIYAPTTNYQNIVMKWASQSSSTTSGPRYELFDYSVDSGTTWTKQGLSQWKDSSWLVFNQTTVAVEDPAAFNNPKFVFRIKDSVNTALGSGNVRYDNVTVEGDTIVPGGVLIHFWDFNTFAGAQHNPAFFPLPADYTIHDSTKAKILFGLFPGTSPANLTYFDNVVLNASAPDYDTVNQQWTSIPALGVVPSGSGIRMRNPNDSTYLYIYMPTVNYKNILLKYASEVSSNASGDSIQTFTYSLDSGITWNISGISETVDSAWITGMPRDPAVIPFRPTPITVRFTDPGANNNPKLVFRMHLQGKNTGTSGNNRFDNFSVQGDSIESVLPTITTTPASYGPFCSTSPNAISVGYTATGAMGTTYSVQITNANGTFPTNTSSNIIGSGSSSPIAAIIPPSTPGTIYRVRVVNSNPGIYGTDNGSNFILQGAAGPINGTLTLCPGTTTALSEAGSGGTWSSANTAVATIGTTGIVSGVLAGTSTITYAVGGGCTPATAVVTVNPLPATITGPSTACVGAVSNLSDITALGTWASSNTTLATVGSGTGAVTGVAIGTLTISYTVSATGCYQTQSVTVNPAATVISGTPVVCAGSSTTLSDIGGGNWTSSNTTLATIGSGTGVVNGLVAGSPVISYTLPTGCFTTTTVTVNPLPQPINGANGCVGTSTIFNDPTAFGAWTSSNSSVATIGSSTGLVTGIALGTSTISYTLSTGCKVGRIDTVNSLPSSITGPTFVLCAGGANITLSDATGTGSWSSSNTYVASVDPVTGIVTSVAAGNPVISYILPTGCAAMQTLTVNPLPGMIGGVTSVYCIGSTTTLSDATGGGVWTSSNTTVATIGSGSGFVTGVSAGLATITYKLPATGCYTTLTENISSSPAPIVGSDVCKGKTVNFTDITAFGAWYSSNGTVATVGSGTGIVTGVNAGTAVITYELSGACLTTATVNINPLPNAISGITNVCVGSTTLLSDAGSGTWLSGIPVIASIGSSTGLVTGFIASTVNITYTLSTGCSITAPVTVNPLPNILGTTTVCIGSSSNLTGSIGGGTWTSSNTSVATIDPAFGVVSGITLGTSTIVYTLPTGCQTTARVTVISLPAAISGATQICAGLTTTLSDVGGGGWYSSDPTKATIGFGTGFVTAVTAGTTTITYSLGTSCNSYSTITVNPLPVAISGITPVCVASNITLSDGSTGGTWISSNTSNATIDMALGTVTGVSAGTSNIVYTLPTGCIISAPVTVNPLPLAITGTANVCAGLTTALTDAGSGSWMSSNTSFATVNPVSGIVTGVAAGMPVITYTLPTSCMITTAVTVNPLPAAITGNMVVCAASTTTLSDATGTGNWSSSNTTLATVDPLLGIVTGTGAGNPVITYTIPTGCINTATVLVNPQPSVITGNPFVCLGYTTTVSDTISGGSWTSSNTSFATIDPVSGVVTAIATGMPTITYTLGSTGCMRTLVINVNPLTAPIAGLTAVCAGSMTALSDTGSGAWSSSNTALALINPTTGVVTGIAPGNPVITYTLPSGCTTLTTLTVNSTPVAYTVIGGGPYCAGGTGVHVQLSGSVIGIDYQLYLGGVPVATPYAGIGSALDFGLETGAGFYTVKATDPSDACSSNMTARALVSIMPSVIPSISIAAGSHDSSCSGTSVNFVATPVNAGHAPYYMWTVNGTSVGADLSTYTYIPVNGDVVAITMASDTVCAMPDTITTSVIMTVLPSALPVATISSIPGDIVCTGDTVRFIATSRFGGIRPIYIWMKNGVPASAGNTYVYAPANNDKIVCKLQSDYLCRLADTVNSNTITMSVSPVYVPSVTITVSPGANIPKGKSDTFYANAANAGPHPTYQWLKNGTAIAGQVNPVFVSNTLANKDSITCITTGTGECGLPSFNSVIVTVSTVGITSVNSGSDITLVPNPNNGTFTVKGSLGITDDQEVSLEITDMLGQVIYRNKVMAQSGYLNEQIQLGNAIANGMYLLNVNTGTENKMFHIVIKQ